MVVRLNCDKYRKSYAEYTTFPIPKSVSESNNYIDWQEHRLTCESCESWGMEQEVIERGYDPTDFPCVHVAYHSTMTCDQHDDAWTCPDMNIVETGDGFGIPIRNGGSSHLAIKNCPWCGIRL